MTLFFISVATVLVLYLIVACYGLWEERNAHIDTDLQGKRRL